jgi:hypothetical protein
VLPEHRGPYAVPVVISHGLFRCRRSAFAAPRGLPHINTVDEQRLAALRLDQSKVSCLFVVFCGGSPTPVCEEYMLHAWLVDQLVAEPIMHKSGSDDC